MRLAASVQTFGSPNNTIGGREHRPRRGQGGVVARAAGAGRADRRRLDGARESAAPLGRERVLEQGP